MSSALQPSAIHLVLKRRTGLFLLACVTIIVTFLFGFGAAEFLRPKPQLASSLITPTDFDITLPEGETIITITDPKLEKSELVKFTVRRVGEAISGIPESERHIEPRHKLSFDDISFFRRELAGVIGNADSTLLRATRIRNWLASTQFRTALPGLATRIPREAYVEMRQGKPVLCGNLAEIYVALCESAGLVARTVGLSLMVREGTFGTDTHAGAEVWVPELGAWVYQDSTFNCYWEIDGKPANALQLHDALMDGREIKLVTPSRQSEALVRNYYVDPRLFFRHISYEYKPGGPLLYFVDGRLEPLNMRDRYWIQTDDPKVIQNLDTDGATITERRGEIVPGIFVQAIGDTIFVRDRRDQNRGIRVRSSSGTVRVCAYEHWRAEELGIFQGRNLVTNGSFNLSSESEGVADGWSIEGPVEVLTTLGGQGMAAQAGGRLWQRVQVQSGHRYLMYAKLSVTRGTVDWSVRDATRGMESSGSVKPTQMSEIVSDVIDSRSGYLEVSFQLPEGGGFRVMDVIVTEMPADAVVKMQRVTIALKDNH